MNQKGFTLLEVLIAIVISSIVLGVVFIFFNTALVSWGQIDKNYIIEQQWSVFTSYLKEDLHNVFISPLSTRTNFVGNSSKIEWTVFGKNEFNLVSYCFDPYKSLLNRKVVNIEGEKIISEKTFFANADLQDINFYYYDRKNNYWKNSWSFKEENSVPLSVKVELKFVNNEVPPVIINLFINKEY